MNTDRRKGADVLILLFSVSTQTASSEARLLHRSNHAQSNQSLDPTSNPRSQGFSFSLSVSTFVFPSYIIGAIFGLSQKLLDASFALPVSVCFQNEMLIVVSRPYKCLNFSVRSPFPTSLLLSGTKMDFRILRISQPTDLCLAAAALSSVDREGGRGASSLRGRGGIRSILRDGAEIRRRPGLTVDRARTVVQWASS